jgi:hypothetical protein
MTTVLDKETNMNEFSNLQHISCNLLVIHFRYSCKVTYSATYWHSPTIKPKHMIWVDNANDNVIKIA